MDHRAREQAAGVYVLDKPGGITSLDAVRRLKRLLSPVRMGHTGTLDPMATGVLAVCVGEATKLVPYMRLEPKTYRGRLRLGLVTDSWDVTGKVVETRRVPAFTGEFLEQRCRELEGVQYLEPPQFSAIKHKGRPLYTYARKGVVVEAEPRATRIEAFQLLKKEGDHLAFELTCSRGTYVRALVHALGQRLGCGACLESLRRTECGGFRIEEAHSLEALETSIAGDRQGQFLLAPAQVLDHLDGCEVREESEKKVRHGNPLRDGDLKEATPLRDRIGERFRIMMQGKLAAVAEVRSDPQGAFLQPLRVLLRAA